MSITEINAMSHAEKLNAMELLWESLTKEEARLQSPQWHESVLAGRRAEIESGEAKFYSIEEAEKMLKDA